MILNAGRTLPFIIFQRNIKSLNLYMYTYKNKNKRPIRVVARGLHATCATNEILNKLRGKGYKILDVTNIIKNEKQENQQGEQTLTKRGLPLFILTFHNKENIEKIHEIKTILGTVV